MFGALRKRISRRLNAEILDRVKKMTMDLFIMTICLSMLKIGEYFGIGAWLGGTVKLND